MKYTDMQKFQNDPPGLQPAQGKPGKNSIRRRRCCGFFLLLLILAVSGCKTADVNSPLVLHPEKYHRVAILPICFGNASPTGFTTENGDTEADRRKAGADLASALTNRLAQKGYQVVNPVLVLSSATDWSGMDLTASGILRQQYDLERIRANPGETNELYTYGFVSALPVLLEKLALPEADAVVLVERWERCITPVKIGKPMSPVAHDITIVAFTSLLVAFGRDPTDFVNSFDSDQPSGAPAGPPAQPEFSACYSLYIFDPNARQIIYSAYQSQRFQSPSRAARALLGALPKIKD